jgi:tRNA-uridine 2-sulfurtransferase
MDLFYFHENPEIVERGLSMHRRCLALYSGGLDSLICIRFVRDLGLDVVPLYFATPFFGFNALLNPSEFKEKHFSKFGIMPEIIDYTDDFIEILTAPEHGYGKYMNPCIDCKIGMLRKAKELLKDYSASFVITGEVLGQRPMSQRKDAMNVIERDSGLKGLLVRPLCAKNMPPSIPENVGIIKKEDMLDITGRGRKRQEKLALSYGVLKEDIPSPAGGCLLTYVQIADKVRQTIDRFSPKIPTRADLVMDVVGRKFIFDCETVMIVPRDELENKIAERLEFQGNVFLKINNIPGPTGVIRGNINTGNLELAASICLRYTKARGTKGNNASWGESPENMDKSIDVPVIDESLIKALHP